MDVSLNLKKTFLIITCTLMLLFTILFFSKNQLLIYVSQNYLKQQNIEITCLDVELNNELDLIINKVCLQHAKFTGEMLNGIIKWRFQSEKAITGIQISEVLVKGRKDSSDNTRKIDNTYSLNSFKNQISELTKIISNYHYITLNIDKVSYQDHTQLPADVTSYSANIDKVNNTLIVSLAKTARGEFLKININLVNQLITGNMYADLNAVRQFFAAHELELPVNSIFLVAIAGKLTSQFKLQQDTLRISNQLEDFSLRGNEVADNEILFDLHGKFNWQLRLDDQSLVATFDSDEFMNLKVNHQVLSDQLAVHNISSEVLAFLEINKNEMFEITPPGKAIYDWSEGSLSFDKVVVANTNKELPVSIRLNNTFMDLSDISKLNAKGDFSANAIINVPIVQSFTDTPANIKLQGDFSFRPGVNQINIIKASKISFTNLKFLHQDKEILIAAAKMSATGKLNIDNNNKITSALQVNSEFSELQIVDQFKLDKSYFNANIHGELSDITVNGELIIEQLIAAKLVLSGDAKQPHIIVQGEEIKLTELMALNINLPVKIDLIDGIFDYTFEGKVNDFNVEKLDKMTLTLSIQNMTGEIDDIWYQDINWQQKFELHQSEINTISTNNNLSIELIEAGTPITNLTATTEMHYHNNQFNIDIHDLSAEAFSGGFSIPKLHWPAVKAQNIDLKLNAIELSELVAIEKQHGIVVTGKISGDLPITVDNNKVTIAEGDLYNVSDGIIQVKNNPAVIQLKKDNAQLKLAFDALQNLHYHQLTSLVSMSDDGQMLLETAIKGVNPDLDNDVNFNVNIDYDLYGLIESIRIADTLEQDMVKKIKQN